MRYIIIFILGISFSLQAQYTANFGISYNDSLIGYIYDDLIVDDPQLFLPDTIYAMSGVDYLLCGDAIGLEKVGESRIVYDYICDVGTETGDNYLINETAIVAEYYPLTIQAKYSQFSCTYIIESKTTTLCVLPLTANIDSTKLLFVGNSLTESGAATFLPVINSLLTNTISKFEGSKGTTPYFHEGISGKTYWWFMYYSAESPFYNGSAFSMSSYRDSNDIYDIDYVFVKLGINDIIANNIDTASIRANQMPRIKSFVDMCLADEMVHNIVICLEPKCENLTLTNVFTVGWELYKTSTGYTYDENYYIQKMHFLWRLINETYGNYAYDAKVSVMPVGINIDRDTGYNYNALHPIAAGYEQIGRAYAAYINYLMSR